MWEQKRLQRHAEVEYEAISRLTHPNIVLVYEAAFEGAYPYVAMELIEGESLESFQSRLPYILPELSVLVAIDILKALEHAHGLQVVHRDLKPANILVSREGRVLVSDFGHARICDLTRQTLTGTILGSPDYMSPEQARGELATPLSDLFSVGAILYFLVTGTRPFSKSSPLATLAAVIAGQVEPPQKRNPKMSEDLAAILLRALSTQPSHRYQSAREFREALENYLEVMGLQSGHAFSLASWVEAPAECTRDALQSAASKLGHRARAALTKGDVESALKTLSHLSLVAPESPLPNEILKELSAMRAARRKRVLVSASIALVLAAASVLGLVPRAPSSSPAVAARAPAPAPVSVESQQPVVQKPIQTQAPVMSAAKKASFSSTLRFEVPRDVKIFWNGRRIDPSRPLKVSKRGRYRLRMEKPGAAPIDQMIDVQNGEPILIRAR